MNIDEIYEKKSELGNEKRNLANKYKELRQKFLELSKECNHDVVVKYRNNHPRKMLLDGHYYCPACEKVFTFESYKEFENSEIKNSDVVDLTELSLVGDDETLRVIDSEVILNYNYGMPNNMGELSKKISMTLKDYERDYNRKTMRLEKRKK